MIGFEDYEAQALLRINMDIFKNVMAAILLAGVGGCIVGAEGRDGITGILATNSELQIHCSVPRNQIEIVELKPFQSYAKDQLWPVLWQGKGRSKIVIDRKEENKDRIYSKFLLIDSLTRKAIGNPYYVTDVSLTTAGKNKLPRPQSIKGLSCIVDMNDAIDLGVKYVHEGVFINDIFDIGNESPQAVWEFEGQKIPLNITKIREIDQRMRQFNEAGIGVFVVFLNQLPKERKLNDPLLHPDSDVENSLYHIGAFNVASDEGLKYYLAALEFLADRYTRPDAKYGLISSVIIGNELQQHWEWYNMGDAPEQKVIKEYLIAMRLGWLALQKYHHDLRVYVSLSHFWTQRGMLMNELREIPGNVFIESIATQAKAEGDFPWNVAFHPYPENLFEPRFWLDKSPTDDFSTPRITFKNIEVLPRFMKQPRMLYRGCMRDIALTEQGFNTPDGVDGEKIQAAAYAYAYYKISHIPEISAFILHRHADHKEEGGLKLGLWNNDPQDASLFKPWKKKYIWDVFKYADTPQWKDHLDFAKPILGIKHWGDTP
jgi:hypothetical protein